MKDIPNLPVEAVQNHPVEAIPNQIWQDTILPFRVAAVRVKICSAWDENQYSVYPRCAIRRFICLPFLLLVGYQGRTLAWMTGVTL